MALGVERRTVRRGITRFNTEGLTGLEDVGRIGRPTHVRRRGRGYDGGDGDMLPRHR